MGSIKKLRKKYKTPAHPWIKENIESEGKLKQQYSFKNKREYFKMASTLKKFKDRAKKLIAASGKQAEAEKRQLMKKLDTYGLLSENAKLDDILGLTINDIMERRLQSIVFRRGFARSMKQARQFITHRHVMVGQKKITSPGYLVPKAEESVVTFDARSSLSSSDHPERAAAQQKK